MFLSYIRPEHLYIEDTNQTDVGLTHMVCVTSSVHSWKNTWELTKTELQPSLGFSIHPSPPFLICLSFSFTFRSHTHTFARKHTLTHMQSGCNNRYQVFRTAGCPRRNWTKEQRYQVTDSSFYYPLFIIHSSVFALKNLAILEISNGILQTFRRACFLLIWGWTVGIMFERPHWWFSVTFCDGNLAGLDLVTYTWHFQNSAVLLEDGVSS